MSARKKPAAKPRKRKPSEPPPKAIGRGRPPLISAELTDRIANHIRATGMSVTGAAEFHRVLGATARKWLEEGKKRLTPDSEYFFTETTQAKRHWEGTLAAFVRQASEKNGALALAALGRRCSDWTEKQQVEVLDASATPDEERVVDALRSNREARKRYAAFLEALEAGIAP